MKDYTVVLLRPLAATTDNRTCVRFVTAENLLRAEYKAQGQALEADMRSDPELADLDVTESDYEHVATFEGHCVLLVTG